MREVEHLLTHNKDGWEDIDEDDGMVDTAREDDSAQDTHVGQQDSTHSEEDEEENQADYGYGYNDNRTNSDADDQQDDEFINDNEDDLGAEDGEGPSDMDYEDNYGEL